jgi:CheY-like chemotaxis protein/tetratricopeptide (TPR) repeat protein
MDLKSQLLSLKNQSSDLTLTERVELSCRLAKQLEKAGEYEAAYEALSEFWPDRRESPKLNDLNESLKAAVLVRAGALAGWLGSTHQDEGSQETAKDLITRAIDIYEQCGDFVNLAQARGELGLCYWREGAYDEARIQLSSAIEGVGDANDEIKAVLMVRAGMVEIFAYRLVDARHIFNEALPFVEQSADQALHGTFHNLFAILFKRLAEAEHRNDYFDKALIEYAAASFHFEQAGHIRFQGCVDINVGFVLSILGRFAEAHVHLNRARDIFLSIDDSVHLAQVNDTRARALLSEGRTVEAERRARSAVKTLEKGDERALLAEALTTHGIALARTGNEARARLQLQRAIDVSEIAGDLEGAGRAKLSIIEELGEKLSIKELISIYQSAIALLKNSQAPSTAKRLISCGAQLFAFLEQLQLKDELPDTWEGFSLRRYLREGERTLIERALRDSGGSVTKAARLLGFNHHQSLISLLNTRHKELLKARTTVRKRRRRLVSPPKRTATESAASRKTKQISILHVEDDKQVANVVADILGLEGMEVKTCGHGMTALKWLAGEDRFDVIIVDNDLPGLSGIELVRRVRKITHRRKTPIIMLSGSDIETEAWRAGVKEFLRKPEDIERIASTVERFLAKAKHKSH